jgi:hypothetical protein
LRSAPVLFRSTEKIPLLASLLLHPPRTKGRCTTNTNTVRGCGDARRTAANVASLSSGLSGPVPVPRPPIAGGNRMRTTGEGGFPAPRLLHQPAGAALAKPELDLGWLDNDDKFRGAGAVGALSRHTRFPHEDTDQLSSATAAGQLVLLQICVHRNLPSRLPKYKGITVWKTFHEATGSALPRASSEPPLVPALRDFLFSRSTSSCSLFHDCAVVLAESLASGELLEFT